MQVARLGDAVGRVGEGQAGGGAAEPAEAELAGEQVGADEAERPRPQEQQVVADERGDGARAEERRRAVAEQRVREGEAERVRVEGVGVEDVQRVVEHRVPDPGDLPGGAHRVAEVGGDAAGHVQHERPAREHRQQHARQRDQRDLAAGERRGGRPAGRPRARPPGCRRLRLGARHAVGARRARAIRVACAGGWGDRCSWPAGVRGRADRRSIREAPADIASHGRRVLVTFRACGLRQTCADEGSRGRSGGRGRGVRRDRAAPAGVRAGGAGRRRARARAGGSRATRRARSLRGRARRRVQPRGARGADRTRGARRGPQRLRPALQRADLRGRLRREGHLPGHGDDALPPPPRAPVRAAWGDARRPPAGRARAAGSTPACWRWWGSASSPGCRTSSPATPPRSCSRASAKSGCATAPTWSSRATTSRRRSRSGRRSRSA